MQNKNNNRKKITLPLIDDFLLSLQTNNMSDKTVYNYERDLKVFEDFLNKETGVEFNDMDKRTMLNYKAYLTSKDRKTSQGEKANKRLSSFSINRMLSALRSYLRFLEDMDYKVPVTPGIVKLIKTTKKNPRVSELNKIVMLIESPTKLEKNKKVALRNRAIFEMFLSTGIRIAELINMKISDIDKDGRIFIRGKGNKERFAYLTHRARKHLENYLQIRERDDSPYVFVPFQGKNAREKNKKLSPSYLQRKIKRYRELLGISTPISCHSIRHRFATSLAEQGASPAAIQRLLGHESLDTTTRYVNIADKFAEESHRKYHPLQD